MQLISTLGCLVLLVGALGCGQLDDGGADAAGDGSSTDGADAGTDADSGSGNGGSAASGGATAGTGGSGAGGTGGAAAVWLPCPEGAQPATSTPAVFGYYLYDGAVKSLVTPGSATGPATATMTGGMAGPSVEFLLAPDGASDRGCVDVSAFTGVEFDLSGTATGDVVVRVMLWSTDPGGGCDDALDCYASPSATTTLGTDRRVAFSSLTPAPWGEMPAFDAAQVVGILWGSDAVAGSNLTVSNVSFY